MAKKRRPPKQGSPEGLFNIGHRLSLESERGCVLLGVAAIDDALEKLLRAYFEMASGEEDTKETVEWLLSARPMPPIGNFWVKVCLCRSVGLIHKQIYKVLEFLRDMRNDFAHLSYLVEISPSDIQSIYDRCPDYRRPAKIVSEQNPEWWREMEETGATKAFSDSHKAFIGICSFVEGYVSAREFYLRRGELFPEDRFAGTKPSDSKSNDSSL